MGKFEITAYGSDCVGCSGITATGTIPQINRTIATDWNVIPPNAEVMINGRVYIAEDKGGVIKGNVIDLFVGLEKDSIAYGRKNMEVYIKK